ncbi:hypothetical protein PABG_02672 [Paracoccidioides brasiliensis Pb03]|nr:hypothetical protein PABG_02672 [Paracoccidioides brasiliensis Pb03]
MAPSLPVGFDDIQTAQSKWDRLVNVIAVVVDALAPKPSGGSSYVSTFTLKDNDFSSAAWNGLKIRYFNNNETHVPAPQHGDVVLLRQIRIRTYQAATVGLCTQNDFVPWVIFQKAPNPRLSPQISMHPNTQKLTATEKSYAFTLIGAGSSMPTGQPFKISAAAAAAPSRSNISKPPTSRGRRKFSLIKDISCGTFVDLVVEVVKTYPEDYQRFLLYVTDYTRNKQLYNYVSEGGGSRDGDEYGYTSRPKRDWPGPFGQMSLQVTLWEPHSHYARQNIKENDLVLLQNVNVKIGRMSGAMEGSLHTDRHYPEKVRVIPINDNDSEDDVKQLVRRKLEYWRRIRAEKSKLEGKNFKKRKASDNNEQPQHMSKMARKQLAQQKRREQEKLDKQSRREDDQPEIEMSFQAKRDQLNPYIRANNPAIPCRSISDILSNESHTNVSPDGIEYRLPFQNLRYKASVRVVDFFPPKLEDFAVQYDAHRAVLSDTDGSMVSDSDEEINSDSARISRRKRWEWRFCLLVEDAGPGMHYNRNAKRERMKLFVTGHDAECLLCLDPVNLRKNPGALSDLREKLFILWGDLEERKSANNATEINANVNINNTDTDKQVSASTKPFICCIKEFGVRNSSAIRSSADEEMEVDDRSGSESGSGSAFGWERRFRMFGTTIM